MTSSAAGSPWEVELDEEADVYLATLRSHNFEVQLARRRVDDAVFAAAGLNLQLTPEGCVVVRAENSGMRTLARIKLGALIAKAITDDALEQGDLAAMVAQLQAELTRALETVGQVHAARRRG